MNWILRAKTNPDGLIMFLTISQRKCGIFGIMIRDMFLLLLLLSAKVFSQLRYLSLEVLYSLSFWAGPLSSLSPVYQYLTNDSLNSVPWSHHFHGCIRSNWDYSYCFFLQFFVRIELPNYMTRTWASVSSLKFLDPCCYCLLFFFSLLNSQVGSFSCLPGHVVACFPWA